VIDYLGGRYWARTSGPCRVKVSRMSTAVLHRPPIPLRIRAPFGVQVPPIGQIHGLANGLAESSHRKEIHCRPGKRADSLDGAVIVGLRADLHARG
jgi:hypothetical protein